jgi:hypothetical protein
MAFLTHNKAKLCKNLITTLVFEKNANFLAENGRKSQKIVIITSTPGFDGFQSRLIGRGSPQPVLWVGCACAVGTTFLSEVQNVEF